MEIQEFLARYPQAMQDLALQTRALIQEVMPGMLEQLDPSANLIGYGTDNTYRGLLCGIVIYPTYINLMLARGASLPDPYGLLEGTGKKARHVKVRKPSDLEGPGVRDLLAAALASAA